MQELGKILEEIESELAGSMGRKREGLLLADKIIRKHLSRENEPEIERYSRDNSGWVPVEEQLPEEGEEVIVTTDVGLITFGYIHDGEWEIDVEPDYPIAWRPLPEPYRPERSVH